MNRTLRRVAAVLALALTLLAVPQLALAAFSGGVKVTQTVATARLTQPSTISGTWTCDTRIFSADEARVATTGVDGTNPAGTVYRYELLNGTRLMATTTTTSPTAPINLSALRDDVSRTWTLRVRPELRSWNTPWTERSFTCRALIPTSGDL